MGSYMTLEAGVNANTVPRHEDQRLANERGLRKHPRPRTITCCLAVAAWDHGRGIDRFRCEEIPRYPELLASMLERLGQDGRRFRAYRCRIAYPFYGSQACMLFTPPDRD